MVKSWTLFLNCCFQTHFELGNNECKRSTKWKYHFQVMNGRLGEHFPCQCSRTASPHTLAMSSVTLRTRVGPLVCPEACHHPLICRASSQRPNSCCCHVCILISWRLLAWWRWKDKDTRSCFLKYWFWSLGAICKQILVCSWTKMSQYISRWFFYDLFPETEIFVVISFNFIQKEI